MKKLLPTLGMVALSASMLGTSTFAWFSMNKTVTATGMSVQARAEGGILIGRTMTATDTTNHVFSLTERKDRTAEAKLKTSATLATPADPVLLLPTSTAAATSWLHSNAQTDAASTSNGTYETLTIDDLKPTAEATGIGYGTVNKKTAGTLDAEDLVYYVYDQVSIVPDAQSANFDDLWVSVCTASTTDDNVSKALRVAFVCEGGNTVICAPVEGATLSYKVGGESGTATTAVDTHGSAAATPTAADKGAANTKKVLLKDGLANTQLNVTIYVYFEGEDTNLFTNNYLVDVKETLDTLSITVSFTCTTVHA